MSDLKRKDCTPQVWALIKEARSFEHLHDDDGTGFQCIRCCADAALKSVSEI